ncbi:MAG: polysaccharide pyruvyl transferase family protein [Alphaproteobacteria bacterium]|mgnify:CR=1 FL=1|nr:hypothetical protein [Hyphomonas sp.]MBR9806035.1 polysaccharide pyruvyl transferase family protein [Alphaproteobacteria bacterium]|tara:strand:- start:707 stop:1573 length:867 start_codon:yes stop_codon:yes gene_type:complete
MSDQSVSEAEYIPFKPSNYKLDLPAACTNLFLNARNTSNVGDLYSTPFEYFTLRGESVAADFWTTINSGEDRFDNIIVGGGVFWKNYVRMPMYYERLRPRKNLFLWGVGIDTPATRAVPEGFMERCALIGSRDFEGPSIEGKKVVFCPCASAMNRAFDISRPPPVHEVVCYLHHNKPIDPPDLFAAYPTMNNYGDFTETLDFLASGKVVITNSYHGLYWATLLGRKVICLEGGGKFAHFKWTPAFVKAADHKNALANADSISAYPHALDECRSLNMSFYQKVMSIMAE